MQNIFDFHVDPETAERNMELINADLTKSVKCIIKSSVAGLPGEKCEISFDDDMIDVHVFDSETYVLLDDIVSCEENNDEFVVKQRLRDDEGGSVVVTHVFVRMR